MTNDYFYSIGKTICSSEYPFAISVNISFSAKFVDEFNVSDFTENDHISLDEEEGTTYTFSCSFNKDKEAIVDSFLVHIEQMFENFKESFADTDLEIVRVLTSLSHLATTYSDSNFYN